MQFKGGMIFDDGLEIRSRDIQLRRERAERELQEARERQRLRHNSAGSLTSASCESTPRRCLSPRTANLSASSSDDDEDPHQHRYNGSGSVSVNNVQQKELERREEKIRELKSENTTLQRQLTSLQSENRALSTQLQDKRDETADLRVQNEKLQEKLAIRDQEVTMDLNKKLESTLANQASIGKMSQQIILLESEISRLKETNTQLEQKLRSTRAELKVKDDLLKSENQGQRDKGVLDAELMHARTELEQLRLRAEADRATLMAAIDEKDKELQADAEDKESAKAALDEVTRSLWRAKEDLHANHMPLATHQEILDRVKQEEEKLHKELQTLRGKVETYSKELAEAKNVCSMQQIVLDQKDGELRDRNRELKSMKKEHETRVDNLTRENTSLNFSLAEHKRTAERLREEVMKLSVPPTQQNIQHANVEELLSYKLMYEDMKVQHQNTQKDKEVAEKLNNRLQREIEKSQADLTKLREEAKESVKIETNYLLAQAEADRYKQTSREQTAEIEKLSLKNEQLQRDAEHLRDSRHDIDGNVQTLKDENSRLRENATELRAQLEQVKRELSAYSVTKEEMETALATAKLTTDVNDMTREETMTEVQLERKHKMVLYKQTKNLRTEINEKNVKLQELERITEKLKHKAAKLKAENSALQNRLKEKLSTDLRSSWDMDTGLTHADLYQQEVKHLQSQLTSTTNEAQAHARKAKARKHDLSYYQSKSEDLEKENKILNSKLKANESLNQELASLRSQLATARVNQSVAEGRNQALSASAGPTTITSRPRSRSNSPVHRRTRSMAERNTSPPMSQYERDRHALYHAAWSVLDQHGLGPPPEERVLSNLDRIWRRNANRPRRF